MKHLTLLLLFLSSLSNLINGQDLIVKTDGTSIKAKILEVNPNDIKYKKFDFIDGPTYSLYKTEIKYIQYPNGLKDEFFNSTNVITSPNNTQTNGYTPDSVLKKQSYGLTFETPYKHGKINGVEKVYYSSGKLFRETSFSNGVSNGFQKTYNENGSLLFECNTVNGKMNGIFKRYNILLGYLEEETFYINGIKNGLSRTYYKSGIVKSEANYLFGDKNGLYKEYNEQGVITKSELFKINVLINNSDTIKHVVSYFESGNLKSEYTKVNDKLNGIEKTYYESGVTQHETTYSNGKKNGSEKYYMENGNMLFESKYTNNIFINDQTYNEDGELLETITSPRHIVRCFDGDGYLINSTTFEGMQVSGLMRNYYKSGIISTEVYYENGQQKGKMKIYKDKRKFMSEKDKMKYDEEKRKNRQQFLSDLTEITTQATQQAVAYQDYQRNPNSQTFNNYAKVVINNYTTESNQAIKNNNIILSSSSNNINVESSAATSSNTQNQKIEFKVPVETPECKKCKEMADKIYKASTENLQKKYYQCNTTGKGAAFACDGNIPPKCICIAHKKHCICNVCGKNIQAEYDTAETNHKNALLNCTNICK